jgi:leucyl aminopeptidase (aminopeptidase T)
LNEIILNSGLSVDYNDVSVQAEKLRLGLTKADFFEVDFKVADEVHTLKLICNGQEAQKSHGLCRGPEADVANLPAGEVYFVPEGAEGKFPIRYETGTVALMDVSGGRIQKATLIKGDQHEVDEHNAKLKSDPMTGELGELGFGTQILPVSGRDIQDEKVLGTMHVATGRSDHLGGHLVPELFATAKNATHDDILFSPAKTPEIEVTEVRMYKGDKVTVVLEHFQPAPYLLNLLN